MWVVAASGLLWTNAAAATISGTVVDQAGVSLSSIEIVVTCIDNGKVWSVHTDKGGRFKAEDLPLGEYVLGAFSAGFVTATRGIRLSDGAEEFLNFTLQSKVSPPSAEPLPAKPVVSASPKASGFAVQIAAYQTKNKAEALRRMLRSGGYPAYVVETNVVGLGRHYRVRVGPFNTAKETKEVASAVRERFPQEGPNFWIIPTP